MFTATFSVNAVVICKDMAKSQSSANLPAQRGGTDVSFIFVGTGQQHDSQTLDNLVLSLQIYIGPQ